MNRKHHFIPVTILTLFIIIILDSCKKDETQVITPPVPPKITFVNTIPGLPHLDFYIGTNKTASITDGFYSSSIDLEAGKKEISVTKAASSEKLAISTVELQNDASFTIFLCGIASKPELLNDKYSINLQNSNKANIRFINLSQSSGGLSLNIKGMLPTYTNQPYKRITSFEAMDPINDITYEIRRTNEESVSASLEKIKLEAGKIYSLIAFDDQSSTGQSIIRLNIIQSN